MTDTTARTPLLASKVAIITGASSGIGRAYAQALAAEGAQLLLTGRNSERLAAVAASLPGRHRTLVADAAEPAECRRIVEEALAGFGRVDLLLANAGLYLPGDLVDTPIEKIEDLIGINVTGTFALIREVLPLLIEQGSGDILVTSSVSGHQAIQWEPVYSASKHAVQAFVHGVRRQLVGSGVRICAIGPGRVMTELWGEFTPEQQAAEIAAGTSIEAAAVADAALFMLTRPRHVTIRDLVILPTAQDI